MSVELPLRRYCLCNCVLILIERKLFYVSTIRMGYVVLTLIADGVFPPGVRRSVFFFNSSEYSTGDRFMAQLVQDSHLKIVKRGWEKKNIAS